MTSLERCFPVGLHDSIYEEYHDHEWGKLNLNEKYLYEMLVLETFQSGLSWRTVLHKRQNFKMAFANWNYQQVARFKQADFKRLMNDKGIIRNRLKIKAAINNAQVFVRLHKTGSSFGSFLQKFIPQPIIHHPHSWQEIASQDKQAQIIAQAMKQEGFKFVGAVTVYSFLQAVGLINDHLENCPFKYHD